MIYLAFLLLFVWFVQGLDIILGMLLFLPVLKKEKETAHLSFPKVSIIFAARDEAESLRPALESFLAQDYPEFEVIAVNDRSTDQTLSLLQSFSTDPRLKTITVEKLPQGWLGKNHALWLAAQQASGEYLLFTDADVIFAPETLNSALKAVKADQLDHLVLFPQIIAPGFWEKLFTTAFGFAFFRRFRPWAASDPKSKAYAGIGAFNLVRKGAYEQIGSHAALRMEVVDDMILGKRIKQAGLRQSVMSAKKLVRVPWVKGFRGVMKAIEKNAFAGLDYNIPVLILVTVAALFVDVVPFILLGIAGGKTLILTFFTIGIIFLVYLACRSKASGSLLVFPFHPLGSLILMALVWRSALLTLARGGILWRDTFYPLADLKTRS